MIRSSYRLSLDIFGEGFLAEETACHTRACARRLKENEIPWAHGFVCRQEKSAAKIQIIDNRKSSLGQQEGQRAFKRE